MIRSFLLLTLLATGCKRGGANPPATGSGSAAGSGSASVAGSAAVGSGSGSAVAQPASPGFATSLQGPFATIDAYCATRPAGDDHTCQASDIAPAGALPAGLLQTAAVLVDIENEDIGCAVALRTAAGWFVGPSSAATCSQPSYIDLQSIDVDTGEAIAAITFGVNWHTKDFDDEAKYKLTALCGVGRGNVPACTPVFLSQCDAHAPVSGCADASFELTWTIDGDTATFTHDRKIDNDAVPVGTQTVIGR